MKYKTYCTHRLPGISQIGKDKGRTKEKMIDMRVEILELYMRVIRYGKMKEEKGNQEQ